MRLCSIYLFCLLTSCPSTLSSSPTFFSTRSPRPWSIKHPYPPLRQQHQERYRAGNRVTHVTMEGAMNIIAPPNFVNNTAAKFLCSRAEDCLATSGYVTSNAGHSSWLHVVGLFLWLLILLYLLGTTASDYFGCTLENLAEELKLSPAVAGVSLLAIGNGATDVFSSLASFVSSDKSGRIGFSAVLGGALFITTVVSGTVALVSAKSCKTEFIRIEFRSFMRDVVFLLTSLAVLAIILLDSKVHLWEAASFLCIYVMYAILVIAGEMIPKKEASLLDPLLPTIESEASVPKLASFPAEAHHQYLVLEELDEHAELLMEDHMKDLAISAKLKQFFSAFYLHFVAWPLAIPQKLTIPVIEKERWSRPLAVSSCFLAPIFVWAMWALNSSASLNPILFVLGVAGLLSIIFGILALCSTENGRPPQRRILWLVGSFVMSIVWFYVIADEVVETLENLGLYSGINPAILGLTVLAWGNSIEDFVGDIALACNGRGGVQIAISGSYAGPLFNVVVGLGLSLIMACWKSDPEPFLIVDTNGILFYIIGFLVAGLVWPLIIMPLKGMILSRIMGFGLLLIYASFLAMSICYIIGLISQ